VLEKIQQAVGKECLPIKPAAGDGTGVVDCFFNPDGESDFSSVKAAQLRSRRPGGGGRREADGKVLEQGEIEPAALHAPFEKALREGHLIPVCFTSARNGAGSRRLLDVLSASRPTRPRATRRRS